MLNTISHQRNANQNYSEVLLYIHGDYYNSLKKNQFNKVGEDLKKLQSLGIAGGDNMVSLLWKHSWTVS